MENTKELFPVFLIHLIVKIVLCYEGVFMSISFLSSKQASAPSLGKWLCQNSGQLKCAIYYVAILALAGSAVYGLFSLARYVIKKLEEADLEKYPRVPIISSEESTCSRIYPGDLKKEDKQDYTLQANDECVICEIEEVRIGIWRKDIFQSKADVIVNAANKELWGGGGIDGAIHEQGEAAYQRAHQRDLKSHLAPDGLMSGQAFMIPSGEINKKFNIPHVIVIAGPKLFQGSTPTAEQNNQLYSCYFNSLVLAHEQGKKCIAFPSISTGKFNFPSEQAAQISSRAIYDFIKTYPQTSLNHITIHFFHDQDLETSLKPYKDIFR